MGTLVADILHIMSETMRRANYDRARYIGDPAYVQMPAKLTTRDYARELAALSTCITPRAALICRRKFRSLPNRKTQRIFSRRFPGMAVANTYTLERIWARAWWRGIRNSAQQPDARFQYLPGLTVPTARLAPHRMS